MSEAYTRLRPEMVGKSTIVKPIVANAVPVDMLLIFNATASNIETDLIRPVASLTKTPGDLFAIRTLSNVSYLRNFIYAFASKTGYSNWVLAVD